MLSLAQFHLAETTLAAEGLVIERGDGPPMRNPWSVVQSQCWERIRPLLAELGLTPSARARLKIVDDPEDPDEI